MRPHVFAIVLFALVLAGAALSAVPRQGASGTIGDRRAAARRTVEAVLAQRAYAGVTSRTWQADLRRRFNEWFMRLWARTLGRRIGERTIAWLLAWVTAAGAILVLVAWLLRSAARRRIERPTALGQPAPPRLPGHILAEQAVALLRQGNAREGARLAYRAAVHRLEEERAFDIDDARTPREYLARLPPAHARRPPLARLTSLFERIWYGSRPATAEDSSELVALLQDLECLTRTPGI